MNEALAIPDTQIETKGQTLLDQAKALTITSRDTYTGVGRWIREVVRPLKDEIKATFRPRIDQANRLHKDLVATERRFLQPVEEAEKLAGAAMEAFDREERRKVDEERRRLEEARRKADEEARLQAALTAEASGEPKLAEMLLDVPQPIFTPPQPEPVKVEGVSFREVWDYEVVNADLIPRDYLAIDEPKIRGVVRALKAETRIPGIKPVMTRTPVIRR